MLSTIFLNTIKLMNFGKDSSGKCMNHFGTRLFCANGMISNSEATTACCPVEKMIVD